MSFTLKTLNKGGTQKVGEGLVRTAAREEELRAELNGFGDNIVFNVLINNHIERGTDGIDIFVVDAPSHSYTITETGSNNSLFTGTGYIINGGCMWDYLDDFDYVKFSNGLFNLKTAQLEPIPDPITPELTIEVVPGGEVDGDGNPLVTENGAGTPIIISRNTTDGDLVVTLASNDGTESAVSPSQVTIPAGQTSVTVQVLPVDDTIVDGPQISTITASAPGFAPATQNVTTADDDVAPTPALSIAPAPGTPIDPATGNPVVTENGAAINWIISRNNTDGDIVVNLASNDTSEALPSPSQITIPAGQASVVVGVVPVDDPIVDGSQIATISASSPGYNSASQDVTVLDDDTISPPPLDECRVQDVEGTTQHLQGTDGKIDTFVVNCEKSNYGLGPTEDGKGIVIWSDKGFDILKNFDKIEFTDVILDLKTGQTTPNTGYTPAPTPGPVNVIHDMAGETEWVSGTSGKDAFKIDANASEFGWNKTEDGQGYVVYNGSTFDILSDIEQLQFNDQTIILDDYA